METNLIQVVNNESFTTSLLVAEKFSKDHKNVIAKIERIIADISTGLILSSLNLFEKSEYTDAHNQVRSMYLINRDGFTLLAMGFTGKEALEWKLKYIEAFNEMERRLHSPNAPQDNRLELARMIKELPLEKIHYLTDLYPEYFSHTSTPGTLEYISDINSTYQKWIDNFNIDREWIGSFPTQDIYINYLRFCHNNNYMSMGKKVFYRTIEEDFNLTKRQKANGYRYFMSA